MYSGEYCLGVNCSGVHGLGDHLLQGPIYFMTVQAIPCWYRLISIVDGPPLGVQVTLVMPS